jgi:internalin A
MPLKSLTLSGCPVRDLTPLSGMTLDNLQLASCRELRNLTPLQDARVRVLNLTSCVQVQDLAPLKGLPIQILSVSGPRVNDLTPLKDMPLIRLSICDCPALTDVTPLKNLRLDSLVFSPRTVTTGIDVLRGMKTLKSIEINVGGTISRIPAEEFWRRYDAGEFKK